MTKRPIFAPWRKMEKLFTKLSKVWKDSEQEQLSTKNKLIDYKR